MTVLQDLLFGVLFLLRALLDTLVGKARRRYVTTLNVLAPQDLVWRITSSRNVRFESEPAIEIATAPRSGSGEVIEGTVTVGNIVLPLSYREVSEKPGEGLIMEILPDGTAPEIALGRDYFVAWTVAQSRRGTALTIAHELTHTSFWGRIAVPLGMRQSARRIKQHCEKIAGVTPPGTSPVYGAIVTGLLTFVSFLTFVDAEAALMLLGLILIHEVGHALAMRWVGQPVQGIYFLPFFGGVAVAAAPHASETERGFVAFMGPGLSLITTAGFFAGWLATYDPVLGQLAVLSALLNGINLAPVLPLDGGQIVDALLSASDPEIAQVINVAFLLAGLGTAILLGWYVLTALLAVNLPMLLTRRPKWHKLAPIDPGGRAWLTTAYLSAIAFYLAIITVFFT